MNDFRFFVCLTLLFFFAIPTSQAGEREDAQHLQQIRSAESGGSIERFERSWCTIAQHKVEQGLQYKAEGESLERAIKSMMFEAELTGRITDNTSPQKRTLIRSFTSYYFTFVYETEGSSRFVLNKAKKLACLDKTLLPPEVKEVIAGAKRARAREPENIATSVDN